MKLESELLLQVFARTVALWLPVRQRIGEGVQSAAAIYERRQAYPGYGIRFAVEGDAAQRQAGWRALRKLAADGLLTIHTFPRGGRGVRLTLAGWEYCAFLAPSPDFYESLDALGRLAELSARSTIAPWVAEVDLEPGASDWGALSGWQEQAEIVEENLLLGLSEAWVESLSDTMGRIVYRPTDEGRAVLENPPTLPPELELPKSNKTLTHFFCGAFATAWTELQSATPSRPGLLPPCPLPGSFIPCRAKRFLDELSAGTVPAGEPQTKTNVALCDVTAANCGEGVETNERKTIQH